MCRLSFAKMESNLDNLESLSALLKNFVRVWVGAPE